MSDDKLSRINVVGTSGSGKSYLSQQIARRLNIPRIEMDQLFWGADWKESPDTVFLEKLSSAINQSRWVLDGNYPRTTPVKWKNVTTVVWIDYSLARVLFQALMRALSRSYHKKELWPGTGNKESFRRTFLSKESVLLWTMQTFWKVRDRYQVASTDPQFGHIQFIRLKSPRQAQLFLNTLRPFQIS